MGTCEKIHEGALYCRSFKRQHGGGVSQLITRSQSLMRLRTNPQSLADRSSNHRCRAQELITDVLTRERGNAFSGDRNVPMIFRSSAGTGGSVDLGSVTLSLAKVDGPKSGTVSEDPMVER